MAMRSWIRKLFARPVALTIRKAPSKARLIAEALEDRTVPSTFTVLNTNDTGAGSLRDAVASANANIGVDTIVFGDGSGSGGVNFLDATPDTITLTSGAITFAGDANLTTLTGPGASLLSVSGNNASRVFNINSGASAALSGLRITGGTTASFGGGGIANSGTVTLTNATVSGNTAVNGFWGGGGVFNYASGSATLTDCIVNGNTAPNAFLGGGGVFNLGSLAMTNCTISGNSTSGRAGGGLGNNYSGAATLTNCTVSGNTAGNGGGLGNDGGNAGGVGMTLTLINCTVSGNIATGGGGGLSTIRGGTLALINSTVSGNTATVNGGGIVHFFASTLTLTNSIVAGNTAGAGPDAAGAVTSQGYNLIGKTDTSTGWIGSDLTGTIASPLNAQLGALASNGGPTQMMALLPTSPAINAGNVATAPTNDQRGLTRFGNTDIGAFEHQFKVTTTADSGNGSLRQAIANANSTAGTDTVVFRIGTGAQTISPSSGLPTIAQAIVIDGSSQTGFAGTPLIRIDGASAGSVNGLTLGAGSGGSTIKGLIVSGFSSSGRFGIELIGNNNTIQGNWIGLNSTGTAAAANFHGVFLTTGNLLGTNGDGVNDVAERNVIAGNSNDGVFINGGANNKIAGNYIGTNAAGNAPINNNFANVFIANSAGNIVGTDGSNDAFNANERNVINGGVLVSRSTVIAGNYIGLNAAGTAALSATSNLGIQFGNALAGARIGTNGDGIADVEERNVISGLNGNGIVTSAGALVIAGNYIGVDAAGATAIPNQRGIQLTTSATGIRIGTNADGVNDAAEGNVISGNSIVGVHLTNGSNGNVVAGNTIGLNAAGAAALGNATGIRIDTGSSNNTIGGATAAAARNIISGNTGFGVDITDSGTTGNLVAGNYIGLDASGEFDRGNASDGVYVHNGASNNTIGGESAATRNVISGNNGQGVQFANATTTGNILQGNYLGADKDGATAIGNSVHGVYVNNAPSNTIGGTLPGAGNVISGNALNGVTIEGASATGTLLQGNAIGTNAGGNLPIANGWNGVSIVSGASGNSIGGTVVGAGNIIAYNSLAGLALAGTAAADNSARQNSFFANGGLAIDAGNDGVTLNTTGAALNAPVITSVRTGAGVIEVEGFARPGKTIEFYVADGDPSGFGEGRTYLATAVEGSAADSDSTVGGYGPGPVNGVVVGSDLANRFHFTIPVPGDFVPGNQVTAVTIGSISEFGANATADLARAFGAPVVDAGENATVLVGQTFSGHGSFSDLDSDSWTAQVNYGDGGGWQSLTLSPPTYTEADSDAYTLAATIGFELKHVYSTPGQYSVQVRVTDDSSQVGIDALTVIVTNAPPVINNANIVVTPLRLSEGGSVMVTGQFDDASAVDSHTVQIIWGDGAATFATVNETAKTFTASHVYRDDNPSNSASDVYALQAIVTDSSGATARSTYGLFFVTLDNVLPSGLTLTPSSTSINEGGLFVLGGSFADPGALDTHRVVITWGDGSPNTVLNLAAGVTSFANVAHTYQNNPGAPAASYALTVSVTDDDEPLTPVSAGVGVTVNNVAPTSVLVGANSVDVFENDTILLSASFTDPGTVDAHRVEINWGDGSAVQVLNLAPGATTFTGVAHRYLDNPTGQPNGAFNIVVKVADSDQPLATALGSRAVTVRNANPTVATLALVPSAINENDRVEVTGSYADAGSRDTHAIVIAWGDGTFSNASIDSTNRTFRASHRYLDDPSGLPDTYTIAATVTDDDSGVGIATRSLTVNNVAPTVRILPVGQQTPGSFQLTSEVRDPGTLDVLTYSWVVTPVGGGPVTTGSGPNITVASPQGTSFDVTLSVSDGDGGVGSQALRVQVLTENADSYTPAATDFPGVGLLAVLGLGGDDVLDLSALSIPVILDGGAGTDALTGGSGDDVIVLHQGNDSGQGRGGNDRYRLTPNSTLSIADGSGNNTLDFGPSSFGVTFDLSQTAGQLQDVLPSTPNLHFVSVNNFGTGQFGTLVGSTSGDNLTAASNSSIFAGAGADVLRVKSGMVNTNLSGGADADQLITTGSGIANIVFEGDDGADLFTNSGINVTGIVFGGGSDADVFQNIGSAQTIDFSGDDGADVFTNTGTAGAIAFEGGADADVFTNQTGGAATTIDFSGDDGADVFTNTGSAGTIIFSGGADADVFQTTTGSAAATIVFEGDDGADVFTNTGTAGAITFEGGADADVFTNQGSGGATIVFEGDDGADVFTNTGTAGTITFGGGADADVFQTTTGSAATTIVFEGDDGADVFTNTGTAGTITFEGGADADVFTNQGGVTTTIVFEGDHGADVFTNTGTAGTITFEGGADADVFTNLGGSTTTIDFSGDDGADLFTNTGTAGTIIFSGGSDADVLQATVGSSATTIDFSGDDGADVLVNQGGVTTIVFTGGADADALLNSGTGGTTIDFSGDNGADLLINRSTATITFEGGADADQLLNTSGGASTIVFEGDDGADLLVNAGSAGSITFEGGSDADVFQTTTGSVAGTIVFEGDDGADLLVNNGTVGTITFGGGSDADVLLNNGSGAATIVFEGDDGADVYVNNGNGNVATIITFEGGADVDAFQNNASSIGRIVFHGDDGADILQNNGAGIAVITFEGGADADFFQNTTTATGVASIDFSGDDGADVLVNNAAGAVLITFEGGADADILQNTGGGVTTIVFEGDDGADVLVNTGSGVGRITFEGGSDADVLANSGSGVSNITFEGGSDADVLQNTSSSVTGIVFEGDDGADVFINTGSGASNITFEGGSDADVLQNTGSGVTGIVFEGDDGADLFVNTGSGTSNIVFSGGADNDSFWNYGIGLTNATFRGDDGADTLTNTGGNVVGIVFEGDDGADTLANSGAFSASIIFTGGADNDVFQNTGASAGLLSFLGGTGADKLVNSGSAANINFGGDDGADTLINIGGTIGQIVFTGGADADLLQNSGNNVAQITFTGGADADMLQNSGNGVATISFEGDAGADTLDNSGHGGAGSSIVFTGLSGDDLYIERGQVAQMTFTGGQGNDRVVFSGAGTVTLSGGAGSDGYAFVGSPQAVVTLQEVFVAGDVSVDAIDFSSFTTGGISLDLSRTTSQSLAAGLSLTLSNVLGFENAVGTSFADTLIGNDLANTLTGASLADDRITGGPGWNGVTQWVYLDFDTETEPGEHVYTQAERDAIQARVEADYHGPDAQNPWFHVNFTQSLGVIPQVLRDAGQFVTEFFNRTPSFNRPGGEASELDFRNVNLGGTTSIQVNGLTGGANQPETSSANFVALASKIAAHELAHLMGVRHADAFGPIGYGAHAPPGNDGFKPAFTGPEGGFESFSHLIGSPASIGSDRFNDLENLYFGAREATKLTFIERGTVAPEQTAAHGSRATAQAITLASLAVPNTDPAGMFSGSTLNVAALAVTGHIGLVGGHSESDFYSFTGRRGDLFSIEILSTGLSRLNGDTIDSVLRIYDAAGNLVPHFGGTAVNDDQFEPTDSLLLDVTLPADGVYYIEVDTFARSPSDPMYDATNPTSPLNPANTASILNPLNPNFSATALANFLATRDDADTGNYELFLYRFAASNRVDIGDSIQGGAGDDTIRGGMGGDNLRGGAGNDLIDPGDGSAPTPTPADQTVHEGAAVTVTLTTSGAPSVAWQVVASNGQAIADGSGASLSFVPIDNGAYTLTYTILGSQGDVTSDTLVVTVLNAAPTAALANGGAVNEGSTGSVSFSGQGDSSSVDATAGFRYAYDFNNDGVFDLGNGTYSGGVTSTTAAVPASYLSNGPFNRVVKGRVIDKDGAFSDYTTTIVVNNVVPTVNVGGNEPLSTLTLSRSGSFSDPGADAWTATVDYGDGSGAQPLTLNADKTFALSHTYASGSVNFTVTVTVNDGTATGSASFQVVNNVPAAIEAGANQTANEGALVALAGATFSNPYSTGTHTATINWGDGTASVAAGVNQSPSGTGVAGVLTGSHAYADNGTYTVTVTVTVPLGATSSDSFTVTVNNVAPTLAAISGPTLVIPGQPLAYSASFTDPGFNNPLNSGEVAETFVGTVNWGDGSATEAATVTWTTGSPGAPSTGSVSKGHIYSTPGNYTITFTLNDDDSGSATRTLAVKATESAYVLAASLSEALSVSGNGRVVLPGVIEVNSTSPTAIVASGNAQITATQIHVVGGYSRKGDATISPAPTIGGTAAADPLASLAAPSVSGATGSVDLSGNSSLTINPGRYSRIKVSGNASLTMLPGVYVILGGGMSVTGNANVTGNGVMIYNAGGNYPSAGGDFGGIAVTGNGTVDLTPPAVGNPYAGILFFQSRDNPRALAISGNGLLGIHGTIYARSAQLALSGNAELKAALVVHSMTVSGNASSSLVVEGDLGVVNLAKTLLGADLWVYVDNANGAFQADAMARIDSAIAGLNALLGSHSVFIAQVNSPGEANLVIDAAATTPVGGVSQGVLGFFTEAQGRSKITLVLGWNWYQLPDPGGIGSGQFDFQTIVTHELGHALGLGHSSVTSSVMHSYLSAGTVKRTLTETDLSIPECDDGDPLFAAGYPRDLTPAAILQPGAALDERLESLASATIALLLPERASTGSAGGNPIVARESRGLILNDFGKAAGFGEVSYSTLVAGLTHTDEDMAVMQAIARKRSAHRPGTERVLSPSSAGSGTRAQASSSLENKSAKADRKVCSQTRGDILDLLPAETAKSVPTSTEPAPSAQVDVGPGVLSFFLSYYLVSSVRLEIEKERACDHE